MPGKKSIKSDAWRWFRAELDRLLGPDQAADLWTELARRRREESTTKQRKRAARDLAYYAELLTERKAQGRATARIEATIARLRGLLEDSGE